MAEEKEKQEKPVEPQKEIAEKKPEAKPKAEAKVDKVEAKPVEGASEKKLRKVARMTLVEVEAEIKAVKEKMGGFQSHFAQDLLARKKVLAESSKHS